MELYCQKGGREGMGSGCGLTRAYHAHILNHWHRIAGLVGPGGPEVGFNLKLSPSPPPTGTGGRPTAPRTTTAGAPAALVDGVGVGVATTRTDETGDGHTRVVLLHVHLAGRGAREGGPTAGCFTPKRPLPRVGSGKVVVEASAVGIRLPAPRVWARKPLLPRVATPVPGQPVAILEGSAARGQGAHIPPAVHRLLHGQRHHFRHHLWQQVLLKPVQGWAGVEGPRQGRDGRGCSGSAASHGTPSAHRQHGHAHTASAHGRDGGRWAHTTT